MSRIVYLSYPTGAVSGGQKVVLRHVEALARLGFQCVWWRSPASVPPPWLDFVVPMEVGADFRPDDILVLPSDAPNALLTAAKGRHRVVVFEQNQFTFAGLAYDAIDQFPPDRAPTFIAVGQTNARSIRRAYPAAKVEIIPCFADERLFRPEADRVGAVAYSPRKRQSEAKIIQAFFKKVHARHAALPWSEITNLAEREVARALGSSSLFLSLSRFESVGMTPLEAMASGAVCAGFTGIGGREFATDANGFWVPEDDCEAAADALAEAADLVATGGAPLRQMREAAFETAQQWSYARFVTALEDVWTRLAPEARTHSPQ